MISAREVSHGRSNEPGWGGSARGGASARVWRDGARRRGQDVTPAQACGSGGAVAWERAGNRLTRTGVTAATPTGGSWPSFCPTQAQATSRVISSVSGKPYGLAAVFVALDHGSTEWVGIHAHEGATRFPALGPIRQGVRQHFGGFAKAIRPHSGGAPRSRFAVHLRSLPEAIGLSRHREFARLPPLPGRQWLCRAVHPHPEGEFAVGAALQDHRGAAARATRLPGNLQRHPDDRAPRLPQPGRISPATASTPRSGTVGFNPMSQKPRAVQCPCTHVITSLPR